MDLMPGVGFSGFSLLEKAFSKKREKETKMPGIIIAMILVGTVLVKDSNRKLDEKCAEEVLNGIAESHQECRRYYTSK